MFKSLKNNIFSILLILFIVYLFELSHSSIGLIIFISGLVLLAISLFTERKFLRWLCLALAIFLIILSSLMTRSIWPLLIGVTCFYWLFQTENGHEFMYIGEGRMINKVRKPNYIHPVLIEPQSTRRQLISRQNITQASYHGEDLEWQDMNLVFLGGDTLIDLRDLQLPLGDSVIMIRKVYGRTRIILSQDIGLSINFSTIKGSITIGQEIYDLLGENLRYQEPDYSKRNRRVKLIISQVMGDLEVIIL